MWRSLRARALVAAADHARMRRTLPKPEANQVRNRSTYRENAAQCRELPRGVCKARSDNYRCSRTISLQSQDTRGTDESRQIEFAHCALRSPRCRSRDGHQNPKWQSVRAIFQRVKRRDGNVAEITETHCAISRGVMSRRTHQTESGLAAQR